MPEGETSRRANELLGASSPKVRRLECIRRTWISSRFRHRAIAFIRRQTRYVPRHIYLNSNRLLNSFQRDNIRGFPLYHGAVIAFHDRLGPLD